MKKVMKINMLTVVKRFVTIFPPLSALMAGVNRKLAEETLQNARDKLEVKVKERTADLAKTNEELQKSEERTRLIVETALDAVITMDGDGLITGWNKQAENIFGWSRTEVIGKSISSTIIPPKYREAHENGLKHFLETGEGAVFDKRIEITALHRNGHEFPVEISISHPGRLGDAFIFSAFIRDVTKRKRVEDEREEALYDMGKRIKEITFMYRLAESICEKETLEEIFQDVADFIPPAWQYPEITCGRVCFKEKEYLSNNFKKTGWRQTSDIVVGDKRQGTVEVYYMEERPELDDGPFLKEERQLLYGITRSLGMAIERKNLENQFRQSQKMEVIGQLAGGVAHDFNNLLTGIMGFTKFAIDKLEENSPIHNDLLQVDNLADRAAILTRQLLAFSRRHPLELVVLNISTLVENISKMLGYIIGENIELLFTVADDLGNVRADPGEIEQIIMNLAVNARDAMPTGGKLTIETANVTLDRTYTDKHVGARPGPYVMLAVTDTGSGMDENTKAKIFEPFFTTKESGKGTGLGLSTVYGIVKQHGGNIWVYSEPGKGTSFKIYLPCVFEEKDMLIKKTSKKHIPQGSECILVVEDEEATLTIVERALKMQGYEVHSALTPQEAEKMFSGHKISLLLTDIIMPGKNGRKLYESLKARQPLLKVLYISGYADKAIFHNNVLEPGTPFLQKPFDPSELAQRVREVLDA